ncbi:arginine--tRNA ligase [Candidatus Phytoplasma melaleucae]|uniref:Arginine--tRNA ligase n=1 Tax=Candidatus Phytoplasma melaleucae TaxID=2982630 RepID=A0ABT9DCX2_9MOLU|nr:arginine--tRNA ligase ['Melaleuca sp.' phytoplasma]MDO8167942.1 arginine--tRNA ligase ['Melaleuca sp.' phytoplasma]
MYLEGLKQKIVSILNQKYNIETIIKNSDKTKVFDFYIPLFIYQSKLNKDILAIFNCFKQELETLKEIENIFLDNGFLNIRLQRSLVSKKVLLNVYKSNDQYGQMIQNQQTIILDYSSPNIAKEFSIGHLRSTIIGNVIKNIYQKLGYRTISINHLGDWGTQFGQLIYAYQKWGQKETILQDPVHELQKLYILFHKKARENEKLHQKAKDLFKQLEEKQSQITQLWKWFKTISLREFRKIYKLLGVTFDYYMGESFYHHKALKLLKRLRDQKLVVLEKKAYIMHLDGLPSALMQKDNGSTLYLTRDVACLLYRYKRFNFQKNLYIVGNEQKLHYQQLEKIVQKIGYNLAIKHINFGLILFNNIKISSRKHNNYRLLDIIQKTSLEAAKMIRKKNIRLKSIKMISQKIAIGAIIFNDLKNDRHLNIDFNLKSMIQFEGNTGPYLQYTLVRLSSVMSKLGNRFDINQLKWEKMQHFYKQEHYFVLIKLIDQFSLILERTIQEHMPSILARYLLKIAKYVNQFYSREKILADDPILKDVNILLITTVLVVLKEGLKLLGIPILEKM